MALFLQIIHESDNAVAEIESLAEEWKIKVKVNSSSLISNCNQQRSQFDHRQNCQSKIYYLGIRISMDNKSIIELLGQQYARIKGRLRGTEQDVIEQLLSSHVKSLLMYFDTPIASGLWKTRQIDALEKELYKELLLLLNDFNRNIVVYIARKLALKIRGRLLRQKTITFYGVDALHQQLSECPKQARLYVPKVLAEAIIIAVSRNITCINY